VSALGRLGIRGKIMTQATGRIVALTLAAAAIASPALAALKEVRVTGTVTEITHPEHGADGTQIGDVATITARFDYAKLRDVTDQVVAQFPGATGTNIRAVTMAAPGSGFKITFRGDTFTQAVFAGTDPYGNGADYPLVLYSGNDFWGFSVFSQRADGFGVGFFSEAEIAYESPPAFAGGFGCCYNFGDEAFRGTVDIAHATIADVPEPSAWVLMIAGFGLVGAMARRRSQFVLA